MNTGTIVRVSGAIVDVEFQDALPAIYNALTVDYKVQNQPAKMTLEVQQHLGDKWVRTISMSGTEGIKRGFKVIRYRWAYICSGRRGCHGPSARCDRKPSG